MEDVIKDCKAPVFTNTNPRLIIEDNKRIYAAAPDLLEALIELAPLVGDDEFTTGALKKAFAAISKARGQS